MNKRTILTVTIVVVLVVIGLPAAFFFAAPYLYSAAENRNFEKLRKKSELDCLQMPLHCLVRDEQIEDIYKYFSTGGDPELKDNWGRTALFWSVDKGKYDIANTLLELGADPNTKEENGISVLRGVIVAGEYHLADFFIEMGAELDRYNDDKHPSTILHYCVMLNNLECVEYLVSKGANRYLEDSFGYTVFDRIKMHDHISKEIEALLIKNES